MMENEDRRTCLNCRIRREEARQWLAECRRDDENDDEELEAARAPALWRRLHAV